MVTVSCSLPSLGVDMSCTCGGGNNNALHSIGFPAVMTMSFYFKGVEAAQ